MTDPTASREAGDLTLQVRRADLLGAVARVLDYRPTREVPHHGRVAAIAAKVASRLGGTDPREAFLAGLVHDIGLLNEQWDLTHPPNLAEQANRPVTRSHPLVGAQMLAGVPRLLGVAEIILDHHEWVDGHGYPRGKSGEEVPWASQVLRLADTCDFVLREQGSPELLALLDAIHSRASRQVTDDILEAGTDVLDQPGFYAQLLAGDDVDLLVQQTTHHLAEDDVVASGMEMTALLELLATLADAHASDHIGHSRRVANLAVMVAMAMGLSAEETAKTKWAALVHDLGMVAVPKTLLDEPRLLSEKELRDVRARSTRVATFLEPVEGLEEITRIAACHREAQDGSGCPDGLAGSAIPLGARLIAVCDTFDALTSPRPYRAARDTSLAIDILIRGSGSLFDPDVVSAAVPVFLISEPRGTDREPALS
ncbi:MAG: HD domain-containing phosphohydrolase [Phycisphaerae bacterium]